MKIATTSLMDCAYKTPASDLAAELYHMAFARFGALCLWSTREMDAPSIADAMDAASRLKREGNMATRALAVKIEEACRAVV